VERHASRRQLRPQLVAPAWAETARLDGPAKVSGSAEYLDDLPEPGGCLYAVAIRSDRPHARVRSIDISAASGIPGVEAVLYRDRLFGVNAAMRIGEDAGEGAAAHGEQTVLSTCAVRFEGDFIGLVVAHDQRTAQAAAASVRVEYEDLPHVYTFEEAMAAGAALVHPELGSNVAYEDELAWGDAGEGLAQAEHVVRGTFFGGHAFHRPIEPATSCLVIPQGPELTVWASAKMAFGLRDQVARALGIDPASVRVRIPYIGGGFGAKQITPAMICTAAVSRALNRPVKYRATDLESFRVTSRHAITYRATAGFDRQNRMTALDVELELDTGAYFTGARIVTHNACISAWGCYRIPHFRVRACAAYTNTVPAASFRATGKNQTTFGIECLMDVAAHELGTTPWDIRKANALNRGEFPAETWRVRGAPYVADVPPIDTDFTELIDQAMRGIEWVAGIGVTPGDLQPPAVAIDNTQPDAHVVRGRGIALSLRHGTQGGGRAHAMVSVSPRGVVTVHHNAPDLGTGVYNVLAIVAARTLGVEQSRVTVGHPDTANGMAFVGTIAQRTTVEMGNAVQQACQRLISDLLDVAADVKGGNRDEWSYGNGMLSRGSEEYPFELILASARATLPVSMAAVGSYGYAPSEDRAFGGLDHWAPGAAAAEIEVDRRTGEVRVLRYCAVADAGMALHRTSSVRQVEGGVVMGLGVALYEELHYGQTGLENGDGWGYRIPTAADLPEEFKVILVEHCDGPGPFGSKGLAQTSLPCVTPAIGNAICDALGVRITTSPFTPERVLTAIQENTVSATAQHASSR
jgi:CO/xanthine dehydrogenase Mo-binding subunit